MTELQQILARIDPALLSKMTNRHLVALWNLSVQIGVQTRTQTRSIRIDLTTDPDALRECAVVGLAILQPEKHADFITVRPNIQAALPEWMAMSAFPGPTMSGTIGHLGAS